jgi:hypothetical protein
MGAALPRAHPEQEGCKMKGMNETREPDEQDIDVCDRPVQETEATPDEDLPAAEGGVS